MDARTRHVGWSVAFAALASLPHCGLESEGCTMLGCGPALRVELARTAWEPGGYQIDVKADGVATSCAVTLPFSSCANLVTCDRADPGFLVESSGCALPAAEHEILGVLWPLSGPAEVTVEVRQNGKLLGSGTYEPTYATSQPNGEGCEPTCSQADEQPTLALP
ncbi:MAG: hypothetical protein HY744_21775 [Deltaproteobacteria bacterium]|nr:hypothetical protein [Deltaproteobacteria bacterium]